MQNQKQLSSIFVSNIGQKMDLRMIYSALSMREAPNSISGTFLFKIFRGMKNYIVQLATAKIVLNLSNKGTTLLIFQISNICEFSCTEFCSSTSI